MEVRIFDEIVFDPSKKRVLKKLRIKKGSSNQDLIIDMLEQAKKIGRPKAIYKLVGIDEIDENGVLLDGVRISSRILAVNLQGVNRAFPYITTSGRELYDWKESQGDMLRKYYADEISQFALRTARRFLLNQLKEIYLLGKTSSMNPGSLNDWPLAGQIDLFSLLDDRAADIGVELTESMLMIPNRTVSGIRFASDDDYSNCELCPRDNCSHRDKAYNPELLKSKYLSS
jgi:hypothetical protein